MHIITNFIVIIIYLDISKEISLCPRNFLGSPNPNKETQYRSLTEKIGSRVKVKINKRRQELLGSTSTSHTQELEALKELGLSRWRSKAEELAEYTLVVRF